MAGFCLDFSFRKLIELKQDFDVGKLFQSGKSLRFETRLIEVNLSDYIAPRLIALILDCGYNHTDWLKLDGLHGTIIAASGKN